MNLWLILIEQQKKDRSTLSSLVSLMAFYFRKSFKRTSLISSLACISNMVLRTNDRSTSGFQFSPAMKSEALDTKSTHNSDAQLSEKYSPLKTFKTFIPFQTDRMIRFSYNIVCSESKVILKWRKNNNDNDKKTNKKALQTSTRSKRSHLMYLTNKHSQHRQSTHRKACLEPAIRDMQKLAQNVFLPWKSDTLEPPNFA